MDIVHKLVTTQLLDCVRNREIDAVSLVNLANFLAILLKYVANLEYCLIHDSFG